MACTGFPDRPPVKAGAALCDFFGGTHLYGAAVTALLEAQRTGQGRVVEVAMLEAVFPTLSSPLGLYHALGNQSPPRTGNRHNGMAESPYNVYPASDGWVALFCVSDAHFSGLATAMEMPDLPQDARFLTLKDRVSNMDELDALIAAWTGRHSKSELLGILHRLRVPCAPVREIDEVVNDPHMHERGTLQKVDHPDLGNVVLTTGPLRFEGSETREIAPSKGIGADNADIFQGWLGLTADEFESLRAEGAF
ncbi:CaiB/BaiF CoA-transferase family protein [Bosea sp. (in: a-proteobacteria)]|uniref:CaiB/BaiF CoA transferase family protein n=1 Tax=Bosea sp. (in: a-proteobacteria) TaxID=1871050 RepID=UPI00260A8496|nr:CaiB/BaiF CoA-transferase family protein [Bosea sp. (in: a-proteobacteria)]MCO5090029.1 CoA transferase [Bosea sp. (in: a-proteobacteria)]